MSVTRQNKSTPYFAQDNLSGLVGQLFESSAFRSINKPVLNSVVTWDDPGVPTPLPYPNSSNAGATLTTPVLISQTGNISDINSSTYIPAAVNPGGSETVYINSGDGHLYRGSVDIEAVGNGDVSGPVLSNDGGICSFDGISGKNIKESVGLSEDGSGNLTVGSLVTNSVVDSGISGVNIDSVILKDSSIALTPQAQTSSDIIYQNSSDGNKIYHGSVNLEGSGGSGVTSDSIPAIVDNLCLYNNIDGVHMRQALGVSSPSTGKLNLTGVISHGGMNYTSLPSNPGGTQTIWAGNSLGTSFIAKGSGTYFLENQGYVPVQDEICKWASTRQNQVRPCIGMRYTGSNLFLPSGSRIYTDELREATGSAGIIIESVIIKDGGVQLPPLTTNPSAIPTQGLWLDSAVSKLKFGVNELENQTNLEIRNTYATLSVNSSPYTVQPSDFILRVNTSAARIINLPPASIARNIKIVDITGTASSNNITIVADGSDTILGLPSLILNSNYSSVSLWADYAFTARWFIA
jgi:hypothetical protein